MSENQAPRPLEGWELSEYESYYAMSRRGQVKLQVENLVERMGRLIGTVKILTTQRKALQFRLGIAKERLRSFAANLAAFIDEVG